MEWFANKIECDSCGCYFKEKEGHKCFCKECVAVHPMCNECYLEGRKLGAIKDGKINIGDMDEEEREKLK